MTLLDQVLRIQFLAVLSDSVRCNDSITSVYGMVTGKFEDTLEQKLGHIRDRVSPEWAASP